MYVTQFGYGIILGVTAHVRKWEHSTQPAGKELIHKLRAAGVTVIVKCGEGRKMMPGKGALNDG